MYYHYALSLSISKMGCRSVRASVRLSIRPHMCQPLYVLKANLAAITICLDAFSRLYTRECPSVGPSLLEASAGCSVRNAFVKIDEKWTFTDSK